MKIAVVGTGYVGLVVGACLAENGNEVICVDKDAAKVATLEAGKMPIYEPGLEEMVKRNHGNKRLAFSTNLPAAVKESDVVFIAVGTPQGEDGAADLLGTAARVLDDVDQFGGDDAQPVAPEGHGAEEVEALHGAESEVHDCRRNIARVQRGQQPGIPQTGCCDRGFHETRSRGHWRRRSTVGRYHAGTLRTVHSHGCSDHDDGHGKR